MRRKVVCYTASLLAMSVIAGCSLGFLSSKRKTDVEVTLLFTGNTRGELSPCG